MIESRWFNAFTKSEIAKLEGGSIRGQYYFIGVLDSSVMHFTDIIYAKLTNQMASQTQKKIFPEGYEPFRTSYEYSPTFCLRTMTIDIRRIALSRDLRHICKERPRRQAAILNPQLQEQVAILLAESDRFEIRDRIRRFAADSMKNLQIVVDLMRYRSPGRTGQNLADEFELYLLHREPGFLRELLALLDMPEPVRDMPLAA